MLRKFLNIFLLIFSYAVALGHDVIPHHHVTDIHEFETHDHGGNRHCHVEDHTSNSTHDSHERHHLCHSSADNTSLASGNSEVKSITFASDFAVLFAGDLIFHQYRNTAPYGNSRFYDFVVSSLHFLSSGLRAPPTLV